MCGIAALVDPTGAPIDGAVLAAMTRTLAPRGPDGESSWRDAGVGLGHTRLAILDLTAAAAQPLPNEDDTIRVVGNGEIYNFLDLRAELTSHGHRFRSRCDTEVIVHGYEQWGDDVVHHLDGMFAFVVWDARRRRLLAARDRMGKKPLYFAEILRSGTTPLYAFASEPKALLRVPGFDRRLDHGALVRYLAYEYVPPPRSIFRGARKLDAAERLRLDVHASHGSHASHMSIDKYWDLPFPEEHPPAHLGEATETLRTLLRRAVERRLVSDVPLGVLLSGGLDSSTIAAVAAGLTRTDRLATFCLGMDEPSFDESTHARATAAAIGADHHELRVGLRELAGALPEVVRFADEPLGDASLLPTFLLARFARTHVKVVLGGDGGDELFAGYPTFAADGPARLLLDRLPPRWQRLAAGVIDRFPASPGYFSAGFKAGQFLRGGATPGPRRHQRWLASFLPDEQATLLTEDLWAAVSADDPLADVDARAATGPAREPADRLLDFYARFYLAGDVLTKVDRAAAACGLEVRAPLLDTEIVSFACLLPASLRRRGPVGKRVLRHAARGLVPAAVLARRKRGFAAPVARLLRGELAPTLRDALGSERIRREGLFDPTTVTRLVDDHLAGRRDHRKQLWTLLAFQLWHAEWLG